MPKLPPGPNATYKSLCPTGRIRATFAPPKISTRDCNLRRTGLEDPRRPFHRLN